MIQLIGIANALKTLALTIPEFGGNSAVYLSPNAQMVPDYRSVPFLVIALKSYQASDDTGENSTTLHYWEFGQYRDTKSIEFAGVGLVRDDASVIDYGFFGAFKDFSSTFNRGTLGGLVDYMWFEYHGGYEPVMMIGPQKTETTMLRAISRLRCDGFNEG